MSSPRTTSGVKKALCRKFRTVARKLEVSHSPQHFSTKCALQIQGERRPTSREGCLHAKGAKIACWTLQGGLLARIPSDEGSSLNLSGVEHVLMLSDSD